ncbi:ROK family transcriptional regulator [Mesobacterium pallidum]|uniref:ROK family transcriptional regulator n=1 Tax=Mesobacterium pallidum TaxID=2872037 RepID=UPI001EE2AA3D|nr:ROK family transcriptional regulator [Mesobacterium pallidum]
MSDQGTPPAPDRPEGARQHVLAVIRSAGTIARTEIAQAAGLSPATVTAHTSDLLRAGLIEERTSPAGTETGRRGRPRVALGIRGDAHLLAGIKVAHDTISVVLNDFAGQAIGGLELPIPAGALETSVLCDAISDALARVCAEAGLARSQISGLGVGMAGLVDARRNWVYWSPSLATRNIDLGTLLSQRLGCAVFVDNDANVVAKAEQILGEGRGLRDFIVVTIERGVGMGIVLNNRIHRGARGCGAELGHTKVQIDGALCRCGQRGCLEAYVGDYALLREASSIGAEFTNLAGMHAAAQAGNVTARSIFDRAGRMFALGLSNVIDIFDPALVILAGRRFDYDYLTTETVLDQANAFSLQAEVQPLPELRVHRWGDLMWAQGAAAHAIDEVARLSLARLDPNAA